MNGHEEQPLNARRLRDDENEKGNIQTIDLETGEIIPDPSLATPLTEQLIATPATAQLIEPAQAVLVEAKVIEATEALKEDVSIKPYFEVIGFANYAEEKRTLDSQQKIKEALLKGDINNLQNLIAPSNVNSKMFFHSAEEAELQAVITFGSTALHEVFLCKNKSLIPDLIKLLVKKGADVNAQDISGNTALHKAALYSQVNAAEALLELGADLQIKNIDGYTPAQFAKNNQWTTAPAKEFFTTLEPKSKIHPDNFRNHSAEGEKANGHSASLKKSSSHEDLLVKRKPMEIE